MIRFRRKGSGCSPSPPPGGSGRRRAVADDARAVRGYASIPRPYQSDALRTPGRVKK
jgi:hypothetical protein